MDSDYHLLVPEQYAGIKKDLFATAESKDVEEAAAWFIDMKDRMLDVNSWTAATALTFSLADKHKKTLHRKAHTHDLVQICPDRYQVGDIWSYALVDIVEYDYDPDTDQESMGMRICLPQEDQEGLVYKAGYTTITFICARKANILSASSHIRNMTDTENTAWTNVTDGQWQDLLKSFVDE